MRKVSFYTLGCKVNQYESNAMKQLFEENGYEIVDMNSEVADIYIVNTCTVTNMSDRKSRQVLRRLKDKNPNSVIVAVGCYVQVAKDDVEKIEEIDIALGNEEKKDIVKYVEKYIQENNKVVEVEDISKEKEFSDMGQITYTDKTRAAIKIQDGCNQFCSYCIIPYARGRVRSREFDSIIEEVEHVAKKGIKEIVITGIHIASYGTDKGNKNGLIELLERLNEVKGIYRIRIGSLEPQIITEDFMERLVKLDKICHHFHLSLQSGCDSTLKRMNRKYNTEKIQEIVDRLRKFYSDVILTTDIIVGFPGETEEEFNITYEFLKKIKLYKMHIFPYSPRRGTVASKMSNQIDGNIKEHRSKVLIELSSQNEFEYNNNMIGKNVEVLFEDEEIVEGKTYYKGHTQNYMLVKHLTSEKLDNCLKFVDITDVHSDCLISI